MLIGPALPAGDNPNGEGLVEPPGIAPGSSSLITWAFIPIVRLPGHNQYKEGSWKGEAFSIENELTQLDFSLMLGLALRRRQAFGLDGAVLQHIERAPDGRDFVLAARLR